MKEMEEQITAMEKDCGINPKRGAFIGIRGTAEREKDHQWFNIPAEIKEAAEFAESLNERVLVSFWTPKKRALRGYRYIAQITE